MFSVALDIYATALKYLGFGEKKKRFPTPLTQPLIAPPVKPVLCLWHQYLPMELIIMTHFRIITSQEDQKRSLKEDRLVLTEIFDNKGPWTIVKNRGKENGFDFKSIVTFPPVQMSVFKENSPLKDESVLEMSTI